MTETYKLRIKPYEIFDQVSGEFINLNEQEIVLKHSLLSVSKWEAKWKIPFLNNTKMTGEQFVDYVRCMTITQNVDPRLYLFITEDQVREIDEYIHDDMTATTFKEPEGAAKKSSREIITSEIIYYWMIAFNIPIEFQKWHLNRLITLIRVCEKKNSPSKKMGRNEILSRNRALNASRRKALGSRG